MVFVSGPPGIGKTALLDAFLARVRGADDAWIAQGDAVEQYGAGEAYLPLLAALGRLGRDAGGRGLVDAMRRVAPSWLAQLPALVEPHEQQTLAAAALGATRERMLRELAELFEVATAERPAGPHDRGPALERSLDDRGDRIPHAGPPAGAPAAARHLSVGRGDAKRASAARRDAGAGGEPAQRGDPARAARRARGRDLSPRALRHGRRGRPRDGARPRAHRGSSALRRQRGRLRRAGGDHPRGAGTGRSHRSAGPSLVGHPRRAPPHDRAADRKPVGRRAAHARGGRVAGAEFSVAAVAAALEGDADEIDDQCEGLAWRGQFLRAVGLEEWPDGTVAGRYAFVHALYRNVLYERLAPTRRVRLHRRIGERKEEACGAQTDEIAGELGAHFEAAREVARAVAYRVRAGDVAVRRHADREAVAHFRQAQELLADMRVGAERNRQELEVLVKLAAPLMATAGYAAPEVEAVFERAHALSRAAAPGRYHAPLLRGLVSFQQVRGEHRLARFVGEELLALCADGADHDRVGAGPLRTRRHALRSAGARGRRPSPHERRLRSTIRPRTRPM